MIEEEDLRRLVEIWETHKAANGRPGISRVAGHKEWPGEFFGRIARGLEERAARYKVTIAVSCSSPIVALCTGYLSVTYDTAIESSSSGSNE